ncbi:MAG: hypothetical protein K2I95_09450, partial [Treponemataceae bacterium]|nr:hypothetical protein [Treponemataceae bacterium]
EAITNNIKIKIDNVEKDSYKLIGAISRGYTTKLQCQITSIEDPNSNRYVIDDSNIYIDIDNFKIDNTNNILFHIKLNDNKQFNCFYTDADGNITTPVKTVSENLSLKTNFQILKGDYDFSCSLDIFNINDNVKTYLIYNSGNEEITTTPYTNTSKFGLYYLTYQSDEPVWSIKNFKDFTKCNIITDIKAALQNLQENGTTLNNIILDNKYDDEYCAIGLNSENPYYKIPIESDLMFEALEKESIGTVSIEKIFARVSRNFSSCLFFRISLYFKNNKDSKLKMAHRFCAVFKS